MTARENEERHAAAVRTRARFTEAKVIPFRNSKVFVSVTRIRTIHGDDGRLVSASNPARRNRNDTGVCID